MKKILSTGIVLLFLFCNISFTTLSDENNANLSGKTLYVGGSGTGNYTKIQDAIDNASDGDTVFVYSGTYYELINIHKSITLQGQDKNSTIIDGKSTTGKIIEIRKSNTQIIGLTVRNATKEMMSYGIYTDISSNNVISDIIITDVNYGIYLYSRYSYDGNYISNCIISSCKISKTNTAIILFECTRNNIYNNIILNNNVGIHLRGCWLNTITNNIFENNNNGIEFYYWYMEGESSSNKITYNSFIDNGCGISIYGSNPLNTITYNNFIDNIRGLAFAIPILSTGYIVHRNYWDRPRLLPMVIFGLRVYFLPFPGIIIDWFPAKEPYDIPFPDVL